ncbi:MAG: immunoglobulin-like domain-containing protein [Bacillota bacterium]
MKKFFALALVFLSIFAVAACDGGDDENGDQAHVDEARERLVLAATLDEVKNDINLPTELGNYPDVEIEWSSSDPEVVATDGTVTRPDPGEGNVNVTLTATLTYNDATAERQYALTVIEGIEENLKDDFSALYEESPMGQTVTLQGIVTSRFSGGAFLYDGDTHMAIFDAPNYDIQDLVALGDEIKYTGEFAKYNTLYQATERENYDVLESDVDYDMTPQEMDIEALYDFDPSGDDKDVHGKHFIVEGLVSIKGDNDNIYIEDVDSDKQLEVYYYSLQNSLDALEAKEGELVRVEIVYYTLYSSGDIRVVFQGGSEDIEDVEADLQTQLNADIKNVEDTYTDGSAVTLPSTGGNGTEFTGWTSSDDTILGDDGSFVAEPTNLTTVTYTGTATLGDLSEEVTFEVAVMGSEATAISDVYGEAEGTLAQVEGIVYSLFNGGYYFFDGTNAMAVYNGDYIDESEVAIGDEVSVLGYTTNYHTMAQLENVETMEVLSSGNEANVPVTTGQTPSDLVALDAENNPEVHGQKYEITGDVAIRGGYDNVFIDDESTDDSIMIYYQSPGDSISELEAVEGSNVTIEVIFYTHHDEDGVMAIYQGGADGITVND